MLSQQKYANCLVVHYRGTDGVGHTEFVGVEKYLNAAAEELESGDYDGISLPQTRQTLLISSRKDSRMLRFIAMTTRGR